MRKQKVRGWRLTTVTAALLIAASVGVGSASAGQSGPLTATSALCKGKQFKIGYDVFSATQPFANLVTKGLKDAAKKTGCATVITTVDNTNGPVAIGNVKTMLNEGANAIIDFNILAAFQPAIAKLTKEKNVPADAVVGANLPGYPSVGADNYGAAVIDGTELAKAAKKKFPGVTPYVVIGAEPAAGPIIMQRYHGAVAGVEKVYGKLPSDHVIEVDENASEADAYNKALGAYSKIPKGGVVLTTAVDDEDTHGMYKAAVARKLTFLVNSFGGDPFGLSQVCKDRQHYVGALYLQPEKWGESALAVVMRMANHMSYPKAVGIKGVEATASSSIAHCK